MSGINLAKLSSTLPRKSWLEYDNETNMILSGDEIKKSKIQVDLTSYCNLVIDKKNLSILLNECEKEIFKIKSEYSDGIKMIHERLNQSSTQQSTGLDETEKNKTIIELKKIITAYKIGINNTTDSLDRIFNENASFNDTIFEEIIKNLNDEITRIEKIKTNINDEYDKIKVIYKSRDNENITKLDEINRQTKIDMSRIKERKNAQFKSLIVAHIHNIDGYLWTGSTHLSGNYVKCKIIKTNFQTGKVIVERIDETTKNSPIEILFKNICLENQVNFNSKDVTGEKTKLDKIKSILPSPPAFFSKKK
jgi:hypothetical protein